MLAISFEDLENKNEFFPRFIFLFKFGCFIMMQVNYFNVFF